MSGVFLLLPKLLMAFAIVVAFVLASLRGRAAGRPVFLGLIAGALGIALILDLILIGGASRFWSGSLVVDRVSIFADLILLILGILVMLGGISGVGGGEDGGDFLLLMLLSLGGASVLASAGNLIVVFLGMELSIIPTYALVAFRSQDRRSFEAAIKYFVLSVFASATLFYGLSLLYGATGSITVPLPARTATSGLLLIGIGFVLVGFGWKLAAVPFHQWIPDAFEVSYPEVGAFMAVAPKLAGVIALVRILGGLSGQRAAWTVAVAVLAVASMFWGNLAAFWQTGVKRLLAYSAVAHAGYALIGVAAGNPAGADGAVLYFAAYSTGVVGAFLVVAALAREGVGDTLEEMAGLGRRRPALAGAMTIFLISLIGIPFFSGFWGKFSVFWGAVRADMVWLAVIGVINSAISFGYYGRIIQKMYLEPAPAEAVTGERAAQERVPGQQVTGEQASGEPASAGAAASEPGVLGAESAFAIPPAVSGFTAMSPDPPMPWALVLALSLAAGLTLLWGVLPGVLFRLLG